MTRNYWKPETRRRADGEALYRRQPGGNEELMAGEPDCHESAYKGKFSYMKKRGG